MPNSAVKPHFFEIDDVFANYTIVQFCGSGAYGEVYLAEDITHKTVALKVIPISGGSEVWRMELIGLRHYRQSIEDHHALIEVFHVGETDNYFYYTMEAADNLLHSDETEEYVADTLAHRLERGGRLEPEKVLELANSLLDALEHLSGHDLAHRDIKPANIVFVNGQAKLSDIGLISTTGVRSKVVGTLEFMPPEIADGDPVGYGHDLYSLGKVLYCALTSLLPENYPEVPLTVPLRAWRQFKNAILQACSPNPRQRFYTAADFRAALPSAIKPTTWVDESVEHLRTYKKQHPVAWRLSIISTILIFIALLASASMSYLLKLEMERARRERINFIFRTIDLVNDRQIHLQRIAANSGDSARPWRLQVIAELAANARANGDLDATERYCRTADAILRMWAQEEFSRLLQKHPTDQLPAENEELFKLLEAYSNFSITPLAGYLHDSSSEKLQDTIQTIKNQLAIRWNGPLPGSNWNESGDPDLNFVYVPAGSLDDEPRHSYWIGVNEVTVSTALRMMPELDLNPDRGDYPVTRLSWNDQLELCRLLTLQAQSAGHLPQGYIYRLPYRNEWQFVVNGAWESAGNFLHEQQSIKDYAWYGGNSMYELHKVRTKASGVPPVHDMIGNVSESVLLQETLPGTSPLAGDFGGSFRDRRISSQIIKNSELDLLINNWSGFRIVLAPGNMDYFRNNWYCGKIHQLTYQQHTYEILGAPTCRWKPEIALEWCKLLNCVPVILHDRNEQDFLLKNSKRLRDLPVLMGAKATIHGWQWLDNTPVYTGDWLNGVEDSIIPGLKQYLVWDHGFWRGISADEAVPLLLVKYNKNRQFSKRPGTVPDSPLILKKHAHGKKEYWVLHAPVDWATAKRLAEMLGGQLAVPENQAERDALLKLADEFEDIHLAVGGIRHCGSWQWLNGADAGDIPNDSSNRAISLSDCFITIYDHRICNSNQMDGFICEFPRP
ncbi:MAG: hypothetical protein E7047_07830 [Lentisphaerae bacterium]|nr:hypothetical protein [Lentisphaerota bacterium]